MQNITELKFYLRNFQFIVYIIVLYVKTYNNNNKAK